MALIASFATGLFNAALRALLNRPVAQLTHRAIFVPIAFTIIDYSFIIARQINTVVYGGFGLVSNMGIIAYENQGDKNMRL